MTVPQFDLFENPTVAQRAAFPYLVLLQHDLLDLYATRLMMPLGRLPGPEVKLPRRLCLAVEVAGETFHLASHLCAPFPARLLKRPVGSLHAQADAIRDALDAVISGV